MGADGRLYVAFDAVSATGRTAALASFSGKILRLNADGTTPRDQPSGIPVFASDFQSPRGLDWHPLTGALWAADVKRKDVEELRVLVPRGAEGSTSRTRIAMPAGTGTAAVAFYRGTLLPALTGDLLVAAEEGRHLLRLRFDKRDPLRLVSSERLLQDVAVRSEPSPSRQTASFTSRPTTPCCDWGQSELTAHSSQLTAVSSQLDPRGSQSQGQGSQCSS